jgi:hypothetical protein
VSALLCCAVELESIRRVEGWCEMAWELAQCRAVTFEKNSKNSSQGFFLCLTETRGISRFLESKNWVMSHLSNYYLLRIIKFKL